MAIGGYWSGRSAAASADGNQAVAVGAASKAEGSQSLAFGPNAQAKTQAIAIGGDTFATGNTSIAIGADDLDDVIKNQNVGPVYKGLTNKDLGVSGNYVSTKAAGDGSIVIGAKALSSGHLSTAIGATSESAGFASTAIGIAAKSQGDTSVAIGTGTQTFTAASIAIGRNAVAGIANSTTNLQAIAIGDGARATGNQSISIGTGNVVSGNNSGAFGDPTTITGTGSYSVGNNNTIATNDTFVVGSNVTTTLDNSVFLGKDAAYVAKGTTSDGVGAVTEPVAINVGNKDGDKLTYTGFAGKTPVGVVSVGAAGKERRIQNVAAGLISATSTDAINGSQLYAVASTLGEQVENTYFHVNTGANAGTGNATTNLGKITDAAGAGATGAVTAGMNTIANTTNSVAIGQAAKAGGAENFSNWANLINPATGAKFASEQELRDYFAANQNPNNQVYRAVVGKMSNVAIGHGAVAEGGRNISIGEFAGVGTADNWNIHNVNIGSEAGQNSKKDYSVAIGYRAGALTEAQQLTQEATLDGARDPSILIGKQAGEGTVAYGTVAMGAEAGKDISDVRSVHNIAIGRNAGEGVSSNDGRNEPFSTFGSGANIMMGASAGRGLSGDGNVAIGNLTGRGTIGDNNILMGHLAGSTSTSNRSIIMGPQSGHNTANNDRNVLIGNFVNGGTSFNGKSIRNAVGIGSSAIASGNESVAIGRSVKASSESATAMGHLAKAINTQTIAIGTNSESAADKAISIGSGAFAGSEELITARDNAYTAAYQTAYDEYLADNNVTKDTASAEQLKKATEEAVKAGNKAFNDAEAAYLADANNQSKGINAIAIGNKAIAGAANSISIGTGNLVEGENSGAIGDPSIVKGTNSYSLGNNNAIGSTTDNAISIGGQNNVGGTANTRDDNGIITIAGGITDGATASRSMVVGFKNTVNSDDVMVLGNNVTVADGHEGAVILGKDSGTAGSHAIENTTTATVGNITYGGFAGNVSSAGMYVSVGQNDGSASVIERKIINVAAGNISNTSTEAINGSQLYATQGVINNVANSVANVLNPSDSNVDENGNVTANFTVNGNTYNNVQEALENVDTDTVTVVQSEDKSVTVTKKDNDADGNTVYDVAVAKAKLAPNENGSVNNTNPEGNENSFVTGDDVANAINNSGFNLTTSASEGEVDGTSEELINPGETVTIDAGKNIKLTQANGKVTVATTDNVVFENVTANTVNVGGNTVTGDAITVNGTTVNNINEAINQTAEQAFKPLTFTGDSGSTNRKLGETFAIVAGNATDTSTKNLKTTVTDGQVEISMTENPEFKNITATESVIIGDVNGDSTTLTSTADGLNVGGDKITNVAAGEADTDAVNVSQLKKAQAAATTKVEAGDNVVVTETGNPDGSTTYTVATAKALNVDSVTAGDTVINNDGLTVGDITVTNAPITVNGTTVNNINEAINQTAEQAFKPLTFTGDSGSTNRKLGETFAIVAGNATDTSTKNLKTTVTDGQVEISMTENPVFKTVTATDSMTVGGVFDADGNQVGSPIVLDTTVVDNKVINTISNLTTTLPEPSEVDGGKSGTLPENIVKTNAATMGDVLNAGWNLKNNGAARDLVTPYDTVDFVNGTGTTAVVENTDGKTSTVKYNVNVDDTTVEVDDNGNIAAVTSDITTDTNGVATATTPSSLATAGDVAEAINASGFNIIGAGNNAGGAFANELINPGDTVTLEAGKNLTVAQTNGKFVFATADDVEFNNVTVNDTLTVGPVTINQDGIDAGDTKITNVAAGTDATDAVNVSQLEKAQAAATTKVAGDQGVSVTPTTNTDGSTTYTVAAKTDGTTVKVENGNITAVTSDITTNTDGKVNTPAAPNALATAGDIANAINNSGWNLQAEGTAGQELINPSDTVTFKKGSENLTVARTGSDITYDLAKDININSVQFNDGPKITNDGDNIRVGDKLGNPTKITNVAAGTNPNDAVNVSQLKAAQTVVEGDQGVTVTAGKPDPDTGATTYTVAAKTDGTTTTVDKNGNIAAITSDITTNTSGVATATTPASLVTAGDVAKAINASGFTLKTSEIAGGKKVAGGDELINPGDTVEMIAGKNMQVTQEINGKVTYATKDEVEFNKVTVGPVTINNATGIDAGNTAITNVKAGVAGTDAVNVSQLKAAQTVVEGDQGVTVTAGKPDPDTGATTYTVAAKTDGTTVKVDGNGNIAAVTSDITIDSNGSVGPVTGTSLVTAGTVANAINNSGWNLLNNGAHKDLVRPSDKVNFINGAGTTATVTTDGTSSTVKYDVNVDNDTIQIKDGKLTATVKDTNTVTTVTAGDNIEVKPETDPNGNTTYTVATKKDVNFDSVTVGPVVINKDGINAGDKKITNVAAGDISATSKDAVNGSQLYSAINNINSSISASKEEVTSNDKSVTVTTTQNAKGANVYVVSVNVDGTTITKDATTGAIKANTTPLTNTDGKVNTPAPPNALATAGDIANAINNSGWKLAADGTTGTELINPSDTVTFKAGSKNLTVARDGANITYDLARNINVDSVQIGADGPKITNDDDNIRVGDKDGNATKITNVAQGVDATDAVNVSQLQGMAQHINNRIDGVADDANSGVSSAMAMAALPQAYIPGKSMLTGGIASYNGEGAVAVGFSKLSDNGRWVLKVSGSADTQGNAGGAVGAGFHF
ncbi:hypothetical protein AZ602_07580 [Moraxella sp. RCAD0137]|nr:hypothetical protein AZ602_07580 [Moraxella sp. RCAD0137]